MSNNNHKHNKSNKSWLHNFHNDAFVKKSHIDGYRSRAAYKLLEINQQYNIIKPKMNILELGCTPGSWSQAILKITNQNCKLIGVDLIKMNDLHGMSFIHGDFLCKNIQEQILASTANNKFNLILSDMAPNITGNKDVDQARIYNLLISVIDFAHKFLDLSSSNNSPSSCLIKAFHGIEFNNLLQYAKDVFSHVKIIKPIASKSHSAENYLLCQNK